jgi:hypothetical protein
MKMQREILTISISGCCFPLSDFTEYASRGTEKLWQHSLINDTTNNNLEYESRLGGKTGICVSLN